MNGATAIVFDESGKKVLLVKRRDMPVWVMPGGGIEKSETPKQAAIRETWEESGFEIKIVRQIGEYRYKGKKRKNYVFEGKVIGGKATLSNESKAVEFFKIKELPWPHNPLIEVILEDCKREKRVIKREVQGISLWQVLSYFHKDPVLVIRFLLVRMGIHINT